MSVCKHISRVLGNDHRHAPGIISEITKWYSNSGPEWTVDRLKAIKSSVVLYLATQRIKPVNSRRMTPPQWVRSDRLGFPKGHLGALIRRTINGSDREVSRLLSVLNTYTVLTATHTTKKQKEKFLEAIGGVPNHGFDDKARTQSSNDLRHCWNDLQFWSSIFRGNYRENFSFAGLNTAKPTLGPWRRSAKEWHPWTLSLIESTMVTGPWTDILSTMGVPVIQGAPPTQVMGSVKVLQERGYKARVIAMPVAGLQVAFKPLHEALSHILRNIPEDCTYDQLSGTQWAANSLREGKTVYAFDLSSATDNFPLTYQLAVLDALGYPRTQEFFRTCRGQWQFEDSVLTYTKGQPMGLYGSFSLFALSHHILVRAIAHELKVPVDCYRILGDDVIISNDKVAEVYQRRLGDLSVPISWDKSISSDILTEFAGKVISPAGVIPTVKFPKGDGWLSVQAFLNYSRISNSVPIKWVKPKYRDLAHALAALPIELGGAGVNPMGLPLSDRLHKLDLITGKKGVPHVSDLRSTLLKFASGGHPWVGKVVSFINDQLIKVDLSIASDLATHSPRLVNIPTNVRSLLIQVTDGESAISYQGAMRTTTSLDSIDWESMLNGYLNGPGTELKSD